MQIEILDFVRSGIEQILAHKQFVKDISNCCIDDSERSGFSRILCGE